MPFSNDEQILIVKKSKLKTAVLIIGTGLFIFSLFNKCYCTAEGCASSLGVLLIGWLGALTGGAALTWLANPFLIITWVLIAKNKRYAWIFSLIAALISISFLKFDSVIKNEAGHYETITGTAIGYWLWFSSCFVTFTGSILLRVFERIHVE